MVEPRLRKRCERKHWLLQKKVARIIAKLSDVSRIPKNSEPVGFAIKRAKG